MLGGPLQAPVAGLEFVQTQYCYDVPRLREYMARIRDLGLLEKVFVLVGVGPLASAKTAEWMRNNVPGVHIPDSVVDRLKAARSEREEGLNICVEMIQQMTDIEGVHGIHIMAFRQEHRVGEIVERSGVLGGRQPWRPTREWEDIAPVSA